MPQVPHPDHSSAVLKALKDSFICQISLDGLHVGLYPQAVRAKFVLEQLSFYFSDEQYGQRTYPRQYADAKGFVRLRELSQSGRLRAMGASASVVAQAAAACPHTVLAPNSPPRIRKAEAWERTAAVMARLLAPPLDPIYNSAALTGGADRPEHFLREAAAGNKHRAVPLQLLLSLPPLQQWGIHPAQAATYIQQWRGDRAYSPTLPSVQPVDVPGLPPCSPSEREEDSQVLAAALPLDVMSRGGSAEIEGGSAWQMCPVLIMHIPSGKVSGVDASAPPLPRDSDPPTAWADWGLKWDSDAAKQFFNTLVASPSDMSGKSEQAPGVPEAAAAAGDAADAAPGMATSRRTGRKDDSESDEEFNTANLLMGAASVAQRMGLKHLRPPPGSSGGRGHMDHATAAAMAAVAGLNFRGSTGNHTFVHGGQFMHSLLGGSSAPMRAHSTPPNMNMMGGGLDFSPQGSMMHIHGGAGGMFAGPMDSMGFMMPGQGGAGGFNASGLAFPTSSGQGQMHFHSMHFPQAATEANSDAPGYPQYPVGTLQAALSVAQSPPGRALSALLTPLASLLRWLLSPAVLTTDDYLQRLALRVPKGNLTFVHASCPPRSSSFSAPPRQGTGVSTASNASGAGGWSDPVGGSMPVPLTPQQSAVPERAVAWSIADLASHPQVEVALATSHSVAVALAGSLGGPVSAVVASPVLLLQVAAGLLASEDQGGEGGLDAAASRQDSWSASTGLVHSKPVHALLALLEDPNTPSSGGDRSNSQGPSRQGSDESGTSAGSTDSADIGAPMVLVLPGTFPPQRDWSRATNQLFAVTESDFASSRGGGSSSPPLPGSMDDGGAWHLADGAPHVPVIGVPPHHPGVPRAYGSTMMSSGSDEHTVSGLGSSGLDVGAASLNRFTSGSTGGGTVHQRGGLQAILPTGMGSRGGFDEHSGASSVHSAHSAASASSAASVHVTLTPGAVAALGGKANAAAALQAAGAEHFDGEFTASPQSAGQLHALEGPADSNTTVALAVPSLLQVESALQPQNIDGIANMPRQPPRPGVSTKNTREEAPPRGGGADVSVPPPRAQDDSTGGKRSRRSSLKRRATTLLRQDVAAHMLAFHGTEGGDVFTGGGALLPPPAAAGAVPLQRAQSANEAHKARERVRSDDERSHGSSASVAAPQVAEFAGGLPGLLIGFQGGGVRISPDDAQESALSAATAGLPGTGWGGMRSRGGGVLVSPSAAAQAAASSLVAASSVGSFHTAGGGDWGLTPLAHSIETSSRRSLSGEPGGYGAEVDGCGSDSGGSDEEDEEEEEGGDVHGGVGGLLHRCASGESASLSDALRRAAVELQRGTTVNVAMAPAADSATHSLGAMSDTSDCASFSQLVADSTKGLSGYNTYSDGFAANGVGTGLGLGLPSKDPLVLDSSAWSGHGAGLAIRAPAGFAVSADSQGGGDMGPGLPGPMARNRSGDVPLMVAAAALGTPSVTPRGGLWSGLGGASLSEAPFTRDRAVSVAESVATPHTLHPPPRVVVISKLPAPGRPAWDFSALSWNILADSLALDGTESPEVAAEKAWTHRAPRLKHAMLHYNADLLALQEVQCNISGPTDDVTETQWPGVYACAQPAGDEGDFAGQSVREAVSAASGTGSHRQWLQRCLTGAGYEVMFAPRWLTQADGSSATSTPKRSNFGNLLAWKRGTFSCVGKFLIHLGEAAQVAGTGVAAAMPRWVYPQVVPVALLRHAGTGCTLLATSVHVTANWRQPFTQLLQSMGLSCALCSLAAQTDASSVCALGDFNSLPSAASYEWMVNGSLLRSNPTVQQLAKLGVHLHSGGGERGAGYGFRVGGLDTPSGAAAPSIATSPSHEALDTVCGPPRPGLQFTSAYAQCLGHEPPCTNYVPHFEGCLDYQWAWRLLPVSVLRPLRDASMRNAGHMPNALVPSDHIPLLSVMRFMHLEGQD